MEKYFKISKSELIELIASDWQLTHLQRAGVDNWEDGGLITEYFVAACQAAGLREDLEDEYFNYSYSDLAKTELVNYPEVEP